MRYGPFGVHGILAFFSVAEGKIHSRSGEGGINHAAITFPQSLQAVLMLFLVQRSCRKSVSGFISVHAISLPHLQQTLERCASDLRQLLIIFHFGATVERPSLERCVFHFLPLTAQWLFRKFCKAPVKGNAYLHVLLCKQSMSGLPTNPFLAQAVAASRISTSRTF